MHSVLYAFPSRVSFYGSSRNLMISATCCRVQKWENLPAQPEQRLCLSSGHRLIHLTSRLSATLGGSGGKVEHGELCLPVTSVFYHNLFFLVCFCQLLLSSAWQNKISPNHKKIPPKDTEISPKDKKISPKQNFLKWEIFGWRIGISQQVPFLNSVSFLEFPLSCTLGVMQGSRCLMSSAVLLSTFIAVIPVSGFIVFSCCEGIQNVLLRRRALQSSLFTKNNLG